MLLCSQDSHVFNTTIRETPLMARRGASDRQLLDVIKRLLQERAGRAAIVIRHDLTTLQHFDRVLDLRAAKLTAPVDQQALLAA